MENLRFDEELLQQGYKFLSDVSGNGRYVLIEKGEIKGDCVVDFKFLQTYYNVTDNMIDGKYLIIFYEKGIFSIRCSTSSCILYNSDQDSHNNGCQQ